jgi:hypothetical protein
MVLGILFLLASGVFLILGVIAYAEYLQTVKHLKIVCNKPGSNCPITDSVSSQTFLEISTILSVIGISMMVIHFRNRK